MNSEKEKLLEEKGGGVDEKGEREGQGERWWRQQHKSFAEADEVLTIRTASKVVGRELEA